MNIGDKSSTTFPNRRLTLSQTCEMKSRTEAMFPYTSSWKLSHVDYYEILKHYNYLDENISDDEIHSINREIKILNELAKAASQKLKLIRDEYTQLIKQPLEYYKKMASVILKHKSANCGEVARLMYMAARINDVEEKDVQVSKLGYFTPPKTSFDYKPLFNEVDHVILTMKTKDEEIGIDGILGEIKSLEELKTDYAEKYGKVFGIPKNADIKFLPVATKSDSTRSLPKISDKDAEELRDIYPNLIV